FLIPTKDCLCRRLSHYGRPTKEGTYLECVSGKKNYRVIKRHCRWKYHEYILHIRSYVGLLMSLKPNKGGSIMPSEKPLLQHASSLLSDLTKGANILVAKSRFGL